MPRATRWPRSREVGISMKEVTDTLLAEGVRLFAEAFDKLLQGGREAEHRPPAQAGSTA